MYNEVKPAIYESLDEMYHKTFQVQWECDFNHNPIYTEDILSELREYILIAIEYLTRNDESRLNSQLDAMYKLCNDGLDLLGHRIGYSMTGPYSVRLQTIDRIRAMMKFDLPVSLPTYNKPCYEFYMPYDDSKVKVSCYKVEFTKYGIWFHLRPALYTENDKLCHHVKWECDLSYENCVKGELPFFMTYTEYERI